MKRSTKKTPSRRSNHRDNARRYRERMRSEGLRQVSLWLYDRSSPAFARECRRQSLLASRTRPEADIDPWLDESLAEPLRSGWKLPDRKSRQFPLPLGSKFRRKQPTLAP